MLVRVYSCSIIMLLAQIDMLNKTTVSAQWQKGSMAELWRLCIWQKESILILVWIHNTNTANKLCLSAIIYKNYLHKFGRNIYHKIFKYTGALCTENIWKSSDFYVSENLYVQINTHLYSAISEVRIKLKLLKKRVIHFLSIII